jgi:phytoene/squalene synthetase
MPTFTPELVEEAARVAPDRTLATSFLSAPERMRVITLCLFAYEIGRARAVVSEAGLAAIRLQWWRDVIEQIYSGKTARAQPVATALAATVQEASLPRNLLDAMIDAHEHELEATPFRNWEDIEHYLDETHGNLNRLSLLATGIKAINMPLNTAAREAGIGWGLSRLLAATPQWCTRRSTWLPAVVHEKLDLESLYSGEVKASLLDVLSTIPARVRSARKAANASIKAANLGDSFPALAHACLANRYANAVMPNPKSGWAQLRDVSLLERQLRLTLSVALRCI